MKMAVPRSSRRDLDLVWSPDWDPAPAAGSGPPRAPNRSPERRPNIVPPRSSELGAGPSPERAAGGRPERGRAPARPARLPAVRTPSLGVPPTCADCRTAAARRTSSSPPDRSSAVSSSSCSEDSVFVSALPALERRNARRRQLVKVGSCGSCRRDVGRRSALTLSPCEILVAIFLSVCYRNM